MAQIARISPYWLFLLSVLLLGTATSLQAADLFVPKDYPNIRSALIHSHPGDHVKLAPGFYREGALLMPSGVTLSGLGETPAEVIISGQNSRRILLCESMDAVTIIENITFQNGKATGASSYDQSGGAILLNHSSPIIRNCIFSDNFADSHGGAIRCSNSSPSIINCEFRGNLAPKGGGGALDCSYNSHPMVLDCLFEENFARWGGALSARALSDPAISGSIFVSNEADGDRGFGGGFFADFAAAPSFQGCTFYNNVARFGGAGANLDDCLLDMQECTIVGNDATLLCGGIISSKSTPVIQNSIIAFNSGAGLLGVRGSVPDISCSNIYGNTGGDWIDPIESQRELSGNLSADPMFCDYPPGNSVRFNLMPNSPCSGEYSFCSGMGAWEVGCGITPVTILSFEVQWTGDQAEIQWLIPNQETEKEDFLLNRTTVGTEGMPTPIPFRETSSGSYLGQDPEIEPVDGHQYDYHLFQRQADGTLFLLNSLRLDTSVLPVVRHLQGVHPNPFNPSTQIRLRFTRERQVTVSINDLAGRRVAQLASQTFPAGEHLLTWDGKDATGRGCHSGTYIVLVEVDGRPETRKLTLLK